MDAADTGNPTNAGEAYLAVVVNITRAAHHNPVLLQFNEEYVEQKKPLKETTAGRALKKEADDIVAGLERELEKEPSEEKKAELANARAYAAALKKYSDSTVDDLGGSNNVFPRLGLPLVGTNRVMPVPVSVPDERAWGGFGILQNSRGGGSCSVM